jgi:hypothetical protein
LFVTTATFVSTMTIGCGASQPSEEFASATRTRFVYTEPL